MTGQIDKQSVKFRLGIDSHSQLSDWLEQNRDAKGVAFLGRSNVGKSSLINCLFGNKVSRTSKTPGRTQKVNVFTFSMQGHPSEVFYLFDLPGYGYAKVSKEMKANWDKIMGCFFGQMPIATTCLCLQDARHPNQKTDQDFFNFLDRNKNIALILNKVDKLRTQKEKAHLSKVAKELKAKNPQISIVFKTSSTLKIGIDEVESFMAQSLI